MLNIWHELVYFLNAAIPEIATYGASETLDFANFTVGGGNFTPNSTIDIFKSIVPKISYLMGVVRRNYNMYPSYLLTGLRSAALLRSVQDMMVSVPGLKGELGWSGETAQFLKLKILEGHSMEDDRIFISTKAPNNSLEKSSIIDLIYQPLYIVQEVTDGNARNFVRSRTQVEIARTDGLAHLQLANLDPYMGTPTGTSNVLP